MAYGVEEKQKFIELRALGLSFDKISEQTGISKPTLLKWQGECLEEIQERQYYELENIINQYSLQRNNRFKVLSALLAKAYKELQAMADDRTLETVPADKLLSLAMTIENRLAKDTEQKLLGVAVNQTDKLMAELNKEFLKVD